MKRLTVFILILGCASLFIAGCETLQNILTDAGDEPMTDGPLIDPSEFDKEYAGPIDSADFVEVVDNPYHPLIPGTVRVYEGKTTEGEIERVEVEVTDDTKVILGVTCTVVRDRVWVDGELVEDTFDWFAQDEDGNVWYFGEDSKELEEGKVVSTDGSWEAGVNGATPGIIMKANPEVGDAYRQEFAAGEAEDMAEVLSLNESVTVPFGSFENCVKTMEWTPLEPDVVEHKFYARGIGFVLAFKVAGGTDRIELISGDKPELPMPVQLIDPTEFDEEYGGPINPADFVAGVDHPYWPLTPGVTLIYEGESEDGPERIVVEVLNETKMVLGVACTIVRDRVFLDGELIEDTFDWYAQDKEGNVWYFGEDVQNFENGVFVDSDGAWEAGVDGATPGIIMKADPEVGDQYRQEFWAGEAEDMAKFLSHNESVTVPAGSFDNCWQIMEWSPLEPEVVAHKFYAPGIGSVLEVHVEGDFERVELVEIRR